MCRVGVESEREIKKGRYREGVEREREREVERGIGGCKW